MAELDDKVIVTKQKIIDIADQIRAELSESDEYKLDVMPTKIHEVAQGGGGSAVINPLNITQNGTYTATGNVDGYSPITVAVEPDLEDITITQNGNYKSSQHDGYDEVTVNVSTSANLQTLNVTTNGTYTPTSPVDGYDEVVVNVSESAEKVVMHSDFAQSNTDLQTGVIEFSGNCTYDSTNKKLGMYYNDHRGYANFNYIINQDINYNYKIEIELDEVTEGTRATDKYLFALYLNPNSQSGAELRLYWNNTNSCWALHHSSGRDTYSTETNIHCFDGVKTTLTFEKRSDSTIYDIYIQSPNFNNGTKMLLHDISGNWMTRYLRIGAQGSNNGFENITINDVKITRMLYQAPRLTLLSDENDNKKETIEEKTDEVKEQKKDSVEKASELDA